MGADPAAGAARRDRAGARGYRAAGGGDRDSPARPRDISRRRAVEAVAARMARAAHDSRRDVLADELAQGGGVVARHRGLDLEAEAIAADGRDGVDAIAGPV